MFYQMTLHAFKRQVKVTDIGSVKLFGGWFPI